MALAGAGVTEVDHGQHKARMHQQLATQTRLDPAYDGSTGSGRALRITDVSDVMLDQHCQPVGEGSSGSPDRRQAEVPPITSATSS